MVFFFKLGVWEVKRQRFYQQRYCVGIFSLLELFDECCRLRQVICATREFSIELNEIQKSKQDAELERIRSA